jgi:hypothetical protein
MSRLQRRRPSLAWRVVIQLDAATVLLQWATGGLAFCWVSTRHRMVGLGYGWLLRGTYGALAALAAVIGFGVDTVPVRDAAAVGVALAALAVLAVSVRRRRAGVSGQREEHDRRTARVAAMTGIDRTNAPEDASPPLPVDASSPEFDPRFDLVAPAIGLVGLVAAALAAGGNDLVSLTRVLAGAAFLGAISDAMLLGHWYLVQPGLPRRLLHELVTASMLTWPVEVAALLLPTGMLSVLSGSVDDGWNGTLGWFWVACAVATIALLYVTRLALRERAYSAVMAATGLLYLAILTAFGTDLVARAVLAG